MTILVTGATGTVGRQVVSHLVETGAKVRALTRRPERAQLPAGVEVVRGDLTVPETLVPALAGVTGIHLINFGGDDYAPLPNGEEIVALARRAGVRKVTMLSGWDESTVEAAVRTSDLEWTYLQPTEFMANALDWADAIRTKGVVEEPLGGTQTAMVHEADIGAVAAVALTSDGHAGKTYGLTGPELLTVPEKLQRISEAIGREIRFVELTREQAREKWLAEGVPPEMVEFHFEVFDVPDGTYTVSSTVEEVTGRPARTFAQWAVEHADAFA